MPVLNVAEATLASLVAQMAGGPAVIRSVEPIEPWSVLRVCFEPARSATGSGGETTAVVKVRRQQGGASDPRADPQRMRTEYAALSFLADAAPGLGPRVLAADLDSGLLALDDLAPLEPLFDVLIGADDAAAATGLRLFARRLADLHARTRGGADDYYRTLARLGPTDRAGDRRLVLSRAWDWKLPDLTAVGFAAAHAAAAEMRAARQLVVEPGPFHVLSSGDTGANNFLTDGVRGFFTDWEDAGYRHAALDAACLFVPNSIWMTIARPAHCGADALYRQTLSDAIPEVETPIFTQALAGACVARAADRLSRFAMLDERRPGDESRAQMISTLEAAARAAGSLGGFPQLATWASDCAAFLRARWPDADRAFPDAYTTRPR